MGGIFLRTLGMATAGFTAGCVTGIFGGGGGMVLVPLLTLLTDLEEDAVFPSSVSVILPVCLTALLISPDIPLKEALPWLPGSILGGILAGKWGVRIPVKWLHRCLGILILWGGLRYLW